MEETKHSRGSNILDYGRFIRRDWSHSGGGRNAPLHIRETKYLSAAAFPI